MNITKTLIATAALACFSVGASAMQPLAEEQLSDVTGQAGVSIAAALNVNIGSFVYTDADGATGNNATGGALTANGAGSVSFNGITAQGLLAATIDILDGTEFAEVLASVGVSGVAGFYDGGDVVQIAVPNLTLADPSVLPDVGVASIVMGGSSASFGQIAINNIDLRGTTVWIWAH